jgi:peptide/nickel transport system permease protein
LVNFIIRRVFQTLIVLIIVSFLCFLLIHLTPGDPVEMMLGPTALREQIDFTRHELGLDKPFLEQYVRWAGNAVTGDFGLSLRYNMPVSKLFAERFPITGGLSLAALILGIIFGILMGTISAVRRGTFYDQLLVVLATSGICVPIFWLSIIGVYIFGLQLGWLPVQGWVSPTTNFGDSIRHAIMPVFLLAIPSLAVVARQTRSSMLEVTRQDYIRTAWAKGLTENTIIIKHALKNALIPVVTLVGLQVRILLGGSVLVETVLNIPGMGRLIVDAAFNKDYFIIQGGVLVLGSIICLLNLLVDISYSWLDPRIRYG